ncbi:MAG: sigma-54 dependent transcriptional regulator [Planctomycetota bacterium]|nr:sigma-54 dependent transcriptional regulator [Planctomycetota bacterium]
MIIRIILATKTPNLQGRIKTLLPREGLAIQAVRGKAQLWEKVSGESYDLLIVSESLLPDPPIDLIRIVRDLPDSPEVLILSNNDDEEQRAKLLAAGCYAVINTNLSNSILSETLDALIARRQEVTSPQRTGPQSGPRLRPILSNFVSSSPAMQSFMGFVRRLVNSDATLLITGETGVGKEWLARAIHTESPRATGPFIAINCGALPEALLESELFGHEEGAFTGATRSRRGMFELAHNGTIFLDEVGEMPHHLQVKLLRVVQSREVQRLGSERPLPINVRIMAATNRNLEEEVEAKNFRRDLYYRLSVVNLVVPPLRDRAEDIGPLIDAYIEHFRGQFPQVALGFSDMALKACVQYDWPGNVRELINVVERAVLISEGELIQHEDLPDAIRNSLGITEVRKNENLDGEPNYESWLHKTLAEVRDEALDKLEKAYLDVQLKETKGNIGKTATRAGLDPRSVYSKMKKFGLNKADYKRS